MGFDDWWHKNSPLFECDSEEAEKIWSAATVERGNAKEVMHVQSGDGVKHMIYGDDFVAYTLTDVLTKLGEYEAKEATERGHDA